MASRGVSTVPVFYVTEEGVIYSIQESDYTPDKSRDVEESRIRLANVLRQRKQQQKDNVSVANEVVNANASIKPTSGCPTTSLERLEIDSDDHSPSPPSAGPLNNIANDWCSSDEEDEDDDDESDCSSEDDFENRAISSSLHVHPTATPDHSSGGHLSSSEIDLARRMVRHGASQQRLATSLLQRDEQLRRNQMLARSAARTMRTGNSSKALPSQFVHQPSPADNAAARAVVHHTGSHYHMAGGVQFQRGLRVKGVVSRHSNQGAKLQAARMAQRNMYEAREDARGERTEGVGRSKMKQKKKKTKKEAAAKDM
jgi:hypothetical protein